MPSLLLKNNAFSTLAGSVTNIDTTFAVQSGHGARFPAISGGDWYFLTLQDAANNIEIVRVTALATDTFTVVRAQEGTTARTWAAADVVELRLTAGIAVTTDGAITLTNKTLSTGNTVSGELLNTSTASLQVASGTTAQRPTGATGKVRFNSDTGQYEGWNGTAWSALGGAQAGGLLYENKQTGTTSHTVSTGSNAFSVGPVSVADGVVITVPNGSRWVVL